MRTLEEYNQLLAQPLRVDTDFEETVEAVSWYLAEAAKERFLNDSETERAKQSIKQLAFDLITRICHCDLETIVKKRNELLERTVMNKKLSTLDA